MNDKQSEVLAKMKERGWKAINFITHPEQGVAFIMRAPEAVAILYPDGTLDRQKTPKSSIVWREGYRDLRADKRRAEREERFERQLPAMIESLYRQLRMEHDQKVNH